MRGLNLLHLSCHPYYSIFIFVPDTLNMNAIFRPIVGGRVLGVLIPSIISNKLKLFNAETCHDILSISVEDFAAKKSTGAKSIEAFAKFKQFLEQKATMEDAVERSNQVIEVERVPLRLMVIIQLPTTGIVGESSAEMWRAYLDAVHEFIVLKDLDCKYSGEELIGKTYALFGHRYEEREVIAQRMGKSPERVRQLVQGIISKVGRFTTGITDHDPECRLDHRIVHFLNNERAFMEDELIATIEGLEGEAFKIRNLWFDMVGLRIGSPNKFNFTRGTLVFFNYQRHGDAFSVLGKAAVVYLNERAIEVGASELITHLKSECKEIAAVVLNELMPHMLSKLPEIEMLNNGDSEEQHYRLQFWKLSRGDRRAYRVLHERNEPMFIEDLLTEIKERMRAFDPGFDCTKESLRLTGTDTEFRSRGKLGMWGLAEWAHWDDLQTGGVDDVIRSVLNEEMRSFALQEIVARCCTVRPDLNTDSVQTRCYMVCMRLTDDRFILPEWAGMPEFKGLVIADREKYGDVLKKRSARVLGYLESILVFLEQQPNKTAYSSVIINHLKEVHPPVNNAVFYKLFNESALLRKIGKGQNKLKIQLVNECITPDETRHEGPQVQLRLW